MKTLFLMCATAGAMWSLLMLDGWPAHAGMQGNMPTSVQPLPKYPPVVCVATNWATETCEDRQTPLPRANPLRAFNRQEPEVPRSGKTTVLYYEPGGILSEHEARWKALAESGDDVEVQSLCGSACTMIMAYVPRDRLCFAVTASLWFHEARSGATAETATPSMSTTQYMLNKYPPDIRLWLRDRGGVEKMTVEKWWVLHASELWEMGYRKCDPELAPVPMTKPESVKYHKNPYDPSKWDQCRVTDCYLPECPNGKCNDPS